MAKETRFVTIIRESVKDAGVITVFVDRQTHIQYAFVANSDRGGLTVLLDADGTPMLYEGTLPN